MKIPDGSTDHNLDTLTFEDWINFAFNHPPKSDPKEKPWHQLDEWRSSYEDSLGQLENCIHLFENTSLIEKNYTWEQIDEGLWFLLFDIIEYLVYDEKIPLLNRKKLIESMVALYEKLFSKNPIFLTGWMWWDAICYNYYVRKGIAENEDYEKIREIIFLILKRIIKIDCLKCQVAALHGFGHLMHKDTKLVVEEYLKEHISLSKKIIDYAEACVNGTMDRMGQPLKDEM
jgi:hypothetical protein